MIGMAGAAQCATTRVELDPRVERSRRVILEAVLEELGEVGYGAFTIEGVAARAGVGKSTIYRHWDGKLELVEDAFHTLKAQAHVPEDGPFRDRLVAYLEQVAALVAESTYSTCMPALIDAAERDPKVRAFHSRFSAERRAVLVDLLARGRQVRRPPRQQRPRAPGRRPRRADRPASTDVRRAVRRGRGSLPRRADPAGSATTAEVEAALSGARRPRAGQRSSTR